MHMFKSLKLRGGLEVLSTYMYNELLSVSIYAIRGNQNPHTEEQTTQWPQDTKGVIRTRISKNRQHNDHKIPKG
jgi:hypothetical protein